MSVTREEKIKRLKALKARCERLIVSSDRGPEEWRKDAEALDLAIAALRDPTRGMVERMRGEWVRHEGYDECANCREKTIYGHNFCPRCGAPMTDEAVDMMLERWKEALESDN